MHFCFYIRDDVDSHEFIHDLQAESARRGMTQVRANRVVTVTSEEERRRAPVSTNTLRILEGSSNGWSIVYCKGPEGGQLECVQVLDRVKQTFANAQRSRRQSTVT